MSEGQRFLPPEVIEEAAGLDEAKSGARIAPELERIASSSMQVDRRTDAVRDFEESEKRYLASQAATAEKNTDNGDKQSDTPKTQPEPMENRGKEAGIKYWEQNLSPKNYERFTTRMTEKSREKERGEVKIAERITVTTPDGWKFEGPVNEVEAMLAKRGFGPAAEKSASTVEKPATASNSFASELAKTVSATLKKETGSVANASEAQAVMPETKPEKSVELNFTGLMREIAGLKLKQYPEVRQRRQLNFKEKLKFFFTGKLEQSGPTYASKAEETEAKLNENEIDFHNKRVIALERVFELAQDALAKQENYQKSRATFMGAQERVERQVQKYRSLPEVVMKEEERLGKIEELRISMGGQAAEFAGQREALFQALNTAREEAAAQAEAYPELQAFVVKFNEGLKDLVLNWTTDYDSGQRTAESTNASSSGNMEQAPVTTNNVLPFNRPAPAPSYEQAGQATQAA